MDKITLTREELIIYVSKVAHFLGDSWRVDRRHDEYLILMFEEKKIIFRNAYSYKRVDMGKLKITGIVRNSPYVNNSVKINVSFSRSPKSIALDIEKRLIPDLNEIIKKARSYNNESAKKKETIAHVLHLIKNVGFLSPYTNTRYGNTSLEVRPNNLIAKFNLYNESLDLKIQNLTNEQAIKLAYFIKDL